MLNHNILTTRSDKPEFDDKLLVLDKTDLRPGAEKLDISQIAYIHIKGSPKKFYEASVVILNLFSEDGVATKILKNRWGRTGVVGESERRW